MDYNNVLVKIERIELTEDFKYLWLYYITGINLENHCQKSFKGKLCQYVNFKNNGHLEENIVLDENDKDYYYLCGAHTHEVWENNFHLAFKKEEGSIIEVEEHGIKVKIVNAKRIIFSEDDIDRSYPHADEKKYYTCRNWQFAHYLNNHNIFE